MGSLFSRAIWGEISCLNSVSPKRPKENSSNFVLHFGAVYPVPSQTQTDLYACIFERDESPCHHHRCLKTA